LGPARQEELERALEEQPAVVQEEGVELSEAEAQQLVAVEPEIAVEPKVVVESEAAAAVRFLGTAPLFEV